jgi:hypothetical protein
VGREPGVRPGWVRLLPTTSRQLPGPLSGPGVFIIDRLDKYYLPVRAVARCVRRLGRRSCGTSLYRAKIKSS